MSKLNQKDISSNINQGLEKSEFPQAKDVLMHFNKNIYPDIEKKYHPNKGVIQENTINKLTKLFGIKKTKDIKERSYEELGIQTAQGLTNYILGDYPKDPSRIELLIQAIYLDMMSIAYGNVRLDYHNASKRYETEGDIVKQEIIEKCLKICDNKFWGRVATLTITEDLLIWNSRDGGTTIQHKEDFLQQKKNNS